MKKTQVALAALALAASSAALADGVTLYGTLEAGLTNANAGSGTRFSGAGEWNTTLFGLKGEEDLGGGLKASFNLMGGLETNTGSTNNGGTTGIFNRLAYVAVGSSMGTVGLGHQFSPFIGSYVGTLALAGNNFLVPVCVNAAACDGGGSGQGSTGGFFIPNSVTYAGNFGPIAANVLYSTKNGAADDQTTIGSLGYSADNIFLTAAVSRRKDTYNNWIIGGTYTMGNIKFAANYISHKDKTGGDIDSKTYTVGASYGLTDATKIGANYSKTKRDGDDLDPSLFNISLQHSLSKRTLVYAFFNKGSDGSAVSYQGQGGDGTPTRGIGAGVSHSF